MPERTAPARNCRPFKPLQRPTRHKTPNPCNLSSATQNRPTSQPDGAKQQGKNNRTSPAKVEKNRADGQKAAQK
nr:MAG TPA: hypothetical protein [Bacteriophage sp.]